MQLPKEVTYNDLVLFVSLLYSAVDIVFDGEAFSSCHRPVHFWLLVSYAVVISFRCLHLFGMRNQEANGGDFLLNLRQKGTVAKIMLSAMWLVAAPLFVLWTLVGTWWLYETMHYTPRCLPEGAHTWFVFIWQGLSYVWIVVHVVLGSVAGLLERRLRRAEGDLRQIADEDVVARWGSDSSRLPGYSSLPIAFGTTGSLGALTPAQILSLPGVASYEEKPVSCESCSACDCPICLISFKQGESVRALGSCGHSFHRGCIDLWLLRSPECPLCKRNVLSKDKESNDDETVASLPAPEMAESTVRNRVSLMV